MCARAAGRARHRRGKRQLFPAGEALIQFMLLVASSGGPLRSPLLVTEVRHKMQNGVADSMAPACSINVELPLLELDLYTLHTLQTVAPSKRRLGARASAVVV